MTEPEWLACDDPFTLVKFVTARSSQLAVRLRLSQGFCRISDAS